jgi:hypothetical protein
MFDQIDFKSTKIKMQRPPLYGQGRLDSCQWHRCQLCYTIQRFHSKVSFASVISDDFDTDIDSRRLTRQGVSTQNEPKRNGF